MTPDQCEKVKDSCGAAAMLFCSGSQALVNVRGNYNRVKVESAALIKSGYMLENPRIS